MGCGEVVRGGLVGLGASLGAGTDVARAPAAGAASADLCTVTDGRVGLDVFTVDNLAFSGVSVVDFAAGVFRADLASAALVVRTRLVDVPG